MYTTVKMLRDAQSNEYDFNEFDIVGEMKTPWASVWRSRFPIPQDKKLVGTPEELKNLQEQMTQMQMNSWC